jgi:hypothetical protein
MDYSDKILVAVGCSHTYGTFLNDNAQETCHERSWVKKLEKTVGFKKSINLAIGGASNKRSLRVITDFLIDNADNIDNYLVIVALTEISRTEFPSAKKTFIPQDIFFDKERNGYHINMLGSFLVDKTTDPVLDDFLRTYYGIFSVDQYDAAEINRDIFCLHRLLTSYNVEHYFPIMLGPVNHYKKQIANESIPYITFNDRAIVGHTKQQGYKVGKDVNLIIDCNHFDHDGNQYIAEGIYKHMKGYCNGV